MKKIKFNDILATYTKKVRDKNSIDFFLHYVVRPVSYLITWLFLKLKITANQTTYLSILVAVGACGLIAFGSHTFQIVGAILSIFWILLDCVDGNIARYHRNFSNYGAFIDAVGGYVINAFLFMSMGIAAYYSNDLFIDQIPLISKSRESILFLGFIASMSTILSRLFYQKALNLIGEQVKVITPKKNRKSVILIIAQNVAAISGFLQPILLITVIIRAYSLFVVFYAFVNLSMLIYAGYNLIYKSVKNVKDVL